MFADHTLTPKEALRLCALGTIAAQPMRYGDLAGSVRHFVSRIMGPQIDLMGLSIELLRYEGLVESQDNASMEDNAMLAITMAGRQELHGLLTGRLRPNSDLTKLVMALKFRFMHLLSNDDRKAQADLLLDMVETELARLLDLRQNQGDPGGQDFLPGWLDHEIAQAEQRLNWLNAFRAAL